MNGERGKKGAAVVGVFLAPFITGVVYHALRASQAFFKRYMENRKAHNPLGAKQLRHRRLFCLIFCPRDRVGSLPQEPPPRLAARRMCEPLPVAPWLKLQRTTASTNARVCLGKIHATYSSDWRALSQDA